VIAAGTGKEATMRVHVFCVDIPPLPGNPVSGGGLRNGQIIDLVRSRGHEVTFSAVANDLNSAGHKVERHQPTLESQLYQIHRTRAEAVYYCYPAHCALTADIKRSLGLKVLFDVHGPTFIEEASWLKGHHARCFRRFAAALSIADEISTVHGRQIDMIRTALASIGIFGGAPRISVVPLDLGCTPIARMPDDEPLLLAVGGIFPWQNPLKGIITAVSALERAGRGTLTLIGGPHAVDPKAAEIKKWLKQFASEQPRFTHVDFIPRENLSAYYARAWAMVELCECNIERQMAVTTRTWEHLSLGLPVLYNDYSLLSALIEDAGAGWTVDPQDEDAVRASVAQVIGDRTDVLARGAKAAAAIAAVIGWARERYVSSIL
jgi:glycosyltransferase involved in cell wall biosynthesis